MQTDSWPVCIRSLMLKSSTQTSYESPKMFGIHSGAVSVLLMTYKPISGSAGKRGLGLPTTTLK